MDTSMDSNLASQVLLGTVEGEADCKRAVNDQMESNLLLRLEMEDLHKTLEEKENKLTEAQETIRILRAEVQSLQTQLDVVKRKYLDLLEQRPQASHFVQPDSEAKSMACPAEQNRTEAGFKNPFCSDVTEGSARGQDAVAQNQPITTENCPLSPPARTSEVQTVACVGEQLTLTLYCESEPNPSDPSGQRSSSPAQSYISEPSLSPPTYQSYDDTVEGDRLTTATEDKIEQHRPHETHQTPSTYSRSNIEKLLPLKMVSVRLEDCRHKLAQNGVFIVQGLDDDDDNDDDDGGDADYTVESETYQSDSADEPSPRSSEQKTVRFRQNRALQCNQCTKTFFQPNHLKLHQRTHNSKKQKVQPRQSHRCGTCGKEFPHRSALRIHERVHSGEKPFVCTVCGHAFSQLGNLKTHHSKHQERSPLDDTGTPAPAEEMSSSTPFPGAQHKCEDCGKAFPFQSLLRLHRRTHTGERPYACSLCEKTFSQSGNLRTHMQTHTDNDLNGGNAGGPAKGGGTTAVSCRKSHDCTDCGKAFAFQAQLRAHRRKHTGEKPYACDVCEKAFRQRSSLQAHQLLRHNKDSECGKKLQSRSALLMHSGDKPYACTLCERRFSRPESFRHHKRWHAKELKHLCSHCGKAFVTPSKLKQHVRKHTGEKPFSCPQCFKTFTSSSGLKKHSQIHTGEMPYRCSICDKAFKFQSNLRAHERTHTQERPYLCHLCGKTFGDGSSLSRHQKTHTGDRPHACPHCDRKFHKLTNLRRHLLRHTGQRPHLCAVCGKAFSRSEILKTHQRVHTGEKPYQCNICGERFAYVQSMQSHQKREHLTPKHPLSSGQRRPQNVESSGAPQKPETQSMAENMKPLQSVEDLVTENAAGSLLHL